MTALVRTYNGEAMAALAAVNRLGVVESALPTGCASVGWHNHYVATMRDASGWCHRTDVVDAYMRGAEVAS